MTRSGVSFPPLTHVNANEHSMPTAQAETRTAAPLSLPGEIEIFPVTRSVSASRSSRAKCGDAAMMNSRSDANASAAPKTPRETIHDAGSASADAALSVSEGIPEPVGGGGEKSGACEPVRMNRAGFA